MAEDLCELSMGMSGDFEQAVSRALFFCVHLIRILEVRRQIVSCWSLSFFADRYGEH